MTERRHSGRGPTRRRLFRFGAAAVVAVAATFAFAASRADGEDDKVRLQPYDRVEPEKYPWGWIRWFMNGKLDPHAEMTMGLVHMEPNQVNTLHIHPNSAEFLHVTSGISEHLMGDRWVTLKPGDTLRIPRNVPHQARTKDQAFEAVIVYDTPTRIMIPVTATKPPEPAKAP
jgi:quercetin dioxygenase-like cupin family protein